MDLSKNLNKKDIIIADDGGHLTWTIQSFKIKLGQKLFSAFAINVWLCITCKYRCICC